MAGGGDAVLDLSAQGLDGLVAELGVGRSAKLFGSNAVEFVMVLVLWLVGAAAVGLLDGILFRTSLDGGGHVASRLGQGNHDAEELSAVVAREGVGEERHSERDGADASRSQVAWASSKSEIRRGRWYTGQVAMASSRVESGPYAAIFVIGCVCFVFVCPVGCVALYRCS